MNLKLLWISAVFIFVATIMLGLRKELDIMIEIVYAVGLFILLGSIIIKEE